MFTRKVKGKQITAALLGFGTVLGVTLTTALASASTYTVKAGDSLWSISQQYGVSVDNLTSWNQISNPSVIYPGEVLAIAASVSKTYTVQSGDSLWLIAQRYDVTVQDLASWNQISNPAYITVGEQLVVSAPQTTGTSSGSASSTGASSSSASQGSAASGQAIVNYAETFLGDPYQWGGESSGGFDCSGLVQTVFAHFGISLPRTASEQAQVGVAVTESALQPGDLVFFNTTGSAYSHVGIYTGSGNFVSATNHGVQINSLSNSYWGPKYEKGTNPQG